MAGLESDPGDAVANRPLILLHRRTGAIWISDLPAFEYPEQRPFPHSRIIRARELESGRGLRWFPGDDLEPDLVELVPRPEPHVCSVPVDSIRDQFDAAVQRARIDDMGVPRWGEGGMAASWFEDVRQELFGPKHELPTRDGTYTDRNGGIWFRRTDRPIGGGEAVPVWLYILAADEHIPNSDDARITPQDVLPMREMKPEGD